MGLARRLERNLVVWRQLEGGGEAAQRLSLRTCAPAFQLLDGVDAQPCSLRQSFLRQLRAQSMTPQQLGK